MTAGRSGRPGRQGHKVSAVVALTFDDGPDPVFTEKVLNALDEVSAKATFFVVADQIQGSDTPKEHSARVMGEIQARDHAIQLHCGTHETHKKWTRAQIETDAKRTLDTLSRLGVPRPCLWRPPLGDYKDPESCQAAAALGLQLIRWTWDTADWTGRSCEQMLAAAAAAPLHEDSVVLMHDATRYAARDDCDSTVELIPHLVGLLRERGYDFGSLTAPIPTRPQRPGEEKLLLCDAGAR
jgi:peptidoglycan/xylan/chitin deacetylase (PgdA/CDA1 family)